MTPATAVAPPGCSPAPGASPALAAARDLAWSAGLGLLDGRVRPWLRTGHRPGWRRCGQPGTGLALPWRLAAPDRCTGLSALGHGLGPDGDLACMAMAAAGVAADGCLSAARLARRAVVSHAGLTRCGAGSKSCLRPPACWTPAAAWARPGRATGRVAAGPAAGRRMESAAGPLGRLALPGAHIRRGDMWALSWAGHDLVYLFQRPRAWRVPGPRRAAKCARGPPGEPRVCRSGSAGPRLPAGRGPPPGLGLPTAGG
jgi:hypothetical protein